MANLDEKGVIFSCPHCGQRNRLQYEQLNHSARCGKCKDEIKLAEPVDVENQQFFDLLISRSPIPVLVDFWAPWCGPCKMVEPEFKKVADLFGERTRHCQGKHRRANSHRSTVQHNFHADAGSIQGRKRSRAHFRSSACCRNHKFRSTVADTCPRLITSQRLLPPIN